uniref:Uncharacterized protein n=1 Tax=Salmonella sp. 40 TaxID=1179813 RepID=I3W3P9_9ENTR|nr:hypothetical protein [Salmonella sp. 40]
MKSAIWREGLPGEIYGAAPQKKSLKRNATLLYTSSKWRYYNQ